MMQLVSRVVMVLVIVIQSTAYKTFGPHIADVNILLPPKMTNEVEYRLQGTDGCFKWSWDHHDILSVQPEYNSSNHCSTSARLRSIAPYNGRKETAVYAADVHTGIVIRCKVFIDYFYRIQIFHNSIKLDLDGLATLRVRAFDREENVFSSLVGLQFMWQLGPETDGLPHHLVHVPLKDSPLSDCGGFCGDLDIQIKLEDSGMFSDLCVVKGIEIGHENVSVDLIEPQLKHMADKIILTVAEAMSLYPPSPVFVLIGSSLQYQLKVIRGNIPQVVKLPSPYHLWSSLNSSVARVDPMMGLTRALVLGATTVIVEDIRVDGHKQGSSLNVVLPETLCLYILPLSKSGDTIEEMEPIPSVARWYVVSSRQYLIQMKVFAQGPGAREIYITESDDVKLYNDQSEYWSTSVLPDETAITHGWQNYRILKATSQGLGKMIASLTYSSGHHETKEVIKVVQEVMVCDQVEFSLDKRSGNSHSILLPWAPSVYQEMELKVTGGCGKASSDYKWFSSDMATVSVSASGIVQAKKRGEVTVKAVSIFDTFNYDEVVIEVSIPSSMVMLQNFPVETVMGSYLQAAVTLKASNGAYFYRCDAFSSTIKWKAGSVSFFIVNSTGKAPALDIVQNVGTYSSFVGPPCSWISIHASGAGRTILHATMSKDYHHLEDSIHGPIFLKASAHIAAYPPLTVCQAGDGSRSGGYWLSIDQAEANSQLQNLDKLYLVPGTYLDVLLHGGPEKWDKGVDFIETVEVWDEEHAHIKEEVHVQDIPGTDSILYRVLCQTLGSFKLGCKRGNLIGDDHPLPAIEEVSLSLMCSFPSSIALISDEPVNRLDVIRAAAKADRSPGRIRVTPVTVANNRTIRMAAVGISDYGEAFTNSSSLRLRWELTNCDGLAYWGDSHDSDRFLYGWERLLVLRNESGLCIVRATVVGFSDLNDSRYSTKLLESTGNVLTDAIRLQLVSTLRINPEFNLLYFNPDAKANLSITGGSCFLEAAGNDSRVIDVIQPQPGLQCSQLMLSPKGLGSAIVTVRDIGLTPPLTASALVQVSDVDWINIMSGEELSVMEGSSQSIDLMAGNDDGSTFDSSQYMFMNIHVHIEDHIIELVDAGDISSPGGGHITAPNFSIIGKHLGITTVYVSAKQRSGHEIYSQPIKVEVYAPLRIHPHDIFLVPGASYGLITEGGPTNGVHVEYSSADLGIVRLEKSSGKLSAISPGNTTILATVYGKGYTVICQAHVNVKVGVPSSATINVQSEQLGIGVKMPIYPLFPEGNVFSFYEACKNYKWTVEDEKVLGFHIVEHSVQEKFGAPFSASKGIAFRSYMGVEEISFISVVCGRTAGKTDVSVSFSCDFISGSYSASRSYNTSMSLVVVSDLPLALGAPITWVFPPHYTTSSILPVHPNGYSDSRTRKGTINYSVLRNCDKSNEVLWKDAITIDVDRIKTAESNNLECIQGKDRTTGRTEIATCIRVAEVSQIRITSKQFPVHLIDLAVGSELELPINYCDELGNHFSEARDVVPLYAETNYPDILFVNHTHDGNANIHLKGLRHGRALLRVSIDSNSHKSDYMMVSVGARLHPYNPVLHVGSPINFRVEGLNDQVPGQWFSANQSVLSIDIQSGKAETIEEGSTQVFFKCPSLKLQTTVSVVTRDIVLVKPPKEILTNVPFPTKGYNFSVKFRNSEAIGNTKEVLYDCKVEPPFIGYAKPWMDLDTGSLYCLFFPYSPEHLVHSIPKSKDMRPDISISISASLKETDHVSGSASAIFVGGFSVLEMGKNLNQLNLTPDFNKTVITIFGNTDVEIHWHDRDLIMIKCIYREGFGIGGHAQYEVRMLRAKRVTDKMTITLPATGQRLEVDIKYEPGEGAASSSSTLIWAIIITTVLMILAIFLLIRSLDKPVRYQSIPSDGSPRIAAPATPARTSPSILNEDSPRTPQPFVDYVRRTIDETPYYKREARRRFNAQNTF